MIGRFVQKIRRRETPFYDRLFRLAKGVRRFSFPAIGPLHNALYHERAFRLQAWRWLTKKFYYEPMFRVRCAEVGPGFQIVPGGGEGIPLITGGLRLYLGENVTITERITFSAAGVVNDAPSLHVDHDTYIGYNVLISVADKITIGKHGMLNPAIITDNPGHPMLDTLARLENRRFSKFEVRPVVIGDYVWLATGCCIFPGVTIGDGAIVLPGAMVASMDVPPFTIVSGNPATVRAKLPLPPGLKKVVGEERYKEYRAAHKALKL